MNTVLKFKLKIKADTGTKLPSYSNYESVNLDDIQLNSPKVTNNYLASLINDLKSPLFSIYDFDESDLDSKEDKSLISSNNPSKQTVIDFFVSKGLTPLLAAGIYGNIMLESLLNINAVGDNGTSLGIIQWHNERKNKLELYQAIHGVSLESQLNFLWEELNSKPYEKALADLKSQTTVEGATKSFMLNFEKPKALYANLNLRIKYALS